jgi:hypothetical protein
MGVAGLKLTLRTVRAGDQERSLQPLSRRPLERLVRPSVAVRSRVQAEVRKAVERMVRRRVEVGTCIVFRSGSAALGGELSFREEEDMGHLLLVSVDGRLK